MKVSRNRFMPRRCACAVLLALAAGAVQADDDPLQEPGHGDDTRPYKSYGAASGSGVMLEV